MTQINEKQSIPTLIKEYSSDYSDSLNETAIVLAAGHGKRIKSNTSKMLHKIWEVPTVERVCQACTSGFNEANIIVVVGIKADEVIKTLGKKRNYSYAYQEVQFGTGHAVQIGMQNISDKNYSGTVYIFPGDMGLIDADTVKSFKESFYKSGADMMVLTGIYEGPVEENHYGRIIRVKKFDVSGIESKDYGKVIEIKEYKDIMSLNEIDPYLVKYNSTQYSFTKKELLENREYNSGVFAYKYKPLKELINKIESNNAQNEIYLTDLIELFNRNGYTIDAVNPRQQHVVMGFNNKSVLKEMDKIAQKIVYEKLKDIITIDDPNDFYIDESVVEDLLLIDNEGKLLDIQIGKGAYIGKGVKLNQYVKIGKNSKIKGNVNFEKGVLIRENISVTCYYGQKISIGENSEIYSGNLLKGNITIGSNVKIESGVKITGTDDHPTLIGDNCFLKGFSSIFGSRIDSRISIEHSVIQKKNISKPAGFKGDLFRVKYIIPQADGLDAVSELK